MALDGAPPIPRRKNFMKTKMWMALPLALSLALPAVAQQQESQPANPPAQQEQNVQSQPAQPEQVRKPLEPQTREGFWGKLNPFARKKYVQRQLEPVRGRIGELDQLTAENARMIKDVDARAQEGIRVAAAKANEADMRATEANQRAVQAHETANLASTRIVSVEQAVNSLDKYEPEVEAEIRFRPGQRMLSRKAKTAIDEIAEPASGKNGYIIQVQAFSSGSGAAALENSQAMADAVVRYLVLEHNIPVYKIHTLGLGNAKIRTADGEARRVRGGRVQVTLLKNSIAALHQDAVAGSEPPQGEAGMSGAAVGSSSSTDTKVNADQPVQPASNQSQPEPQQQPR
jgi:hypothetical protein